MATNQSLVLTTQETSEEEVIAAAGFLAGFCGRTREA